MPIRNYYRQLCLAALVAFGISACGGGSGANDDFLRGSHDQNIALASSGSLATASYDNDNAYLVNDGDQTTSLYWAGNVTDDYVTINFGSEKQLSELTVYTNSTPPSDWLLELSNNGIAWQTTALTAGGDIECPPVVSTGKVSCVFASATYAQHVRLRITAVSNIGLIQVYELEAQGH